jgi:gamma-glutamyl hercynylcysteine S-oxide synthase
MHDTSLTPAALAARRGGPDVLAAALQDSRHDTLATFAAFERALPDLTVPMRAELNPPLWELGHIGWFQEYWLVRQPERAHGDRADPRAPRRRPLRADADLLYDSSTVPHDTRWQLPLPDATATRADLAQQLAGTLALLAGIEDGDDDALYFFRLALLHEDMHHEAALYMAQSLGLPIDDARWAPVPLPAPPEPIPLPAQSWTLGSDATRGFVFDNERGSSTVCLQDTLIDAQVVRWSEFLPFVDGGHAGDARWWTPQGWQWRQSQPASAPRYLRRDGPTWMRWRHGRWHVLDLAEPAVHLTLHEAQAWCRWAGRRLPTEGEWECAALEHPGAFRWGDVWEWTASPFAPFAGFEPHPYRDYSAPWFDGRPVLRGASRMTQPRMRHARYRNFFPAHRNDVPAGFRTCAC